METHIYPIPMQEFSSDLFVRSPGVGGRGGAPVGHTSQLRVDSMLREGGTAGKGRGHTHSSYVSPDATIHIQSHCILLTGVWHVRGELSSEQTVHR